LAGHDRFDVATDLFDDADVLMPQRGRLVDRVEASIGPQVRAADTGRGQADDRISRRKDLCIAALLHPNVSGGVQDCTTHNGLLDLDVVELGQLDDRASPSCTTASA
jgi:hypothetical protein